MKKCVACAEDIQLGAVLCRHCKTLQDDPRFTPDPVQDEGNSQPAGRNSLEGLERSSVTLEPVESGSGKKKESSGSWIFIAAFAAVLLVLIALAVAFQPRGQSSGPTQSEMYQSGFSWGQSAGTKTKSQPVSYQLCNELARSFYYQQGQVHIQEEMDEWIQGCLAYVRG